MTCLGIPLVMRPALGRSIMLFLSARWSRTLTPRRAKRSRGTTLLSTCKGLQKGTSDDVPSKVPEVRVIAACPEVVPVGGISSYPNQRCGQGIDVSWINENHTSFCDWPSGFWTPVGYHWQPMGYASDRGAPAGGDAASHE